MTRFRTMRRGRQHGAHLAAALVAVVIAMSGTALAWSEPAEPPVALGRPNPEGTSI